MNLYRYDEGKMYEIHPRFQQFECIVSPADPTSSSLVNMFPNLTSWQYVKDEFKNGFMCHRYSLVEKQGSKTNTYDFWVTVEGQRPIEYSMRYGYDVVFGSHYDEYILRFGRYFPYLAPSEEFLVPHVCQQSDSLVEHSKCEIYCQKKKRNIKASLCYSRFLPNNIFLSLPHFLFFFFSVD